MAVGCERVLAKCFKYFYLCFKGKHDLVLVMSSLLSTAVKAVTDESFRSRPPS